MRSARSIALIALLAAAVLAKRGTAAVPSSTTAGDYAGSTACKTCHPAQWSTFYRNPHFQATTHADASPDQAGCESCHGPGLRHVEAKGGKSTIPNAFSVMQPKAILDACLRCHSADIGRMNIRRSSHTLNGMACTSCHSIHKSPEPKYLLARVQRDLCYSCHANVRAQFQMPFKHRVNEGFMECSDCHNPHGAQAPSWRMGSRPRMVSQDRSSEEPCLKCHVDKRGPFVFEHAAVRVDGCESCHVPHGSANARLLRRPVVFTLCLECHNGQPGFGRTGEGIPLQSPFHDMTQPRWQNCTTCHVRIHGSNADGNFLR